MPPLRKPHEPASRDVSGAGEVVLEVWHAAASNGEPGPLEKCCEGWLDDDDRQRSSRYKHLGARNQHVVGRGMMRRLLSRNTVEPQSIRFATWPHGRPYVCSPNEACRPFNVSHTSGLVLCGLVEPQSPIAIDPETGDGLVGIDVEWLDRRTNIELAERYFSPPEIEYVRGHRSPGAQRHAFLQVWTLKEAFIKAIGTGLHTPLADFAFRDIDSEAPRIEMLDPKLDQGVQWAFHSLSPRPGYLAAIAVGRSDTVQALRVDVACFEQWLAEEV